MYISSVFFFQELKIFSNQTTASFWDFWVGCPNSLEPHQRRWWGCRQQFNSDKSLNMVSKNTGRPVREEKQQFNIDFLLLLFFFLARKHFFLSQSICRQMQLSLHLAVYPLKGSVMMSVVRCSIYTLCHFIWASVWCMFKGLQSWSFSSGISRLAATQDSHHSEERHCWYSETSSWGGAPLQDWTKKKINPLLRLPLYLTSAKACKEWLAALMHPFAFSAPKAMMMSPSDVLMVTWLKACFWFTSWTWRSCCATQRALTNSTAAKTCTRSSLWGLLNKTLKSFAGVTEALRSSVMHVYDKL